MKGPRPPEQKERLAHTKAHNALQRWRDQGGNPLTVRESRAAINWTLHQKGIPAKACSQCFAIKALTSYAGFASAADGLRSYCRSCSAATHAANMTKPEYAEKNRMSALAYYHNNAPARREYSVTYGRQKRQKNAARNAAKTQDPNVLKRCIGACGRTLPETHFRLDRGQNDGLRTRCRDCADSNQRARRTCIRLYGSPTGQTCYLCMTAITDRTQAHADHLHPTSAGGNEDPANLWWTHEFCNIHRGARPLTPDERNRAHSLQKTAANNLSAIKNGSAS